MKALAFSGGKDSMACLHLLRGSLDLAIYVDTGYAYPETLDLVDYAETLVPVVRVKSDRAAQNAREGIPADVVPMDWTSFGQRLSGEKPVMVQGYIGCCFENIVAPLTLKAKELGVTRLVFGQRNDEYHKSPARDGDVVNGIVRVHPIETWTRDEVIAYLQTKMVVPSHYAFKHSSLDCYDCTAFRKDSETRVAWMERTHPAFHQAYLKRRSALDSALSECLT